MAERRWSVTEFEKLSPAEQDDAFRKAVEFAVEAVDPALLDRVRSRILAREAAESA